MSNRLIYVMSLGGLLLYCLRLFLPWDGSATLLASMFFFLGVSTIMVAFSFAVYAYRNGAPQPIVVSFASLIAVIAMFAAEVWAVWAVARS